MQALLTPSAKAIAGDYMTTFSANGKAAIRARPISASRSRPRRLWGIVGVGIIAIALLVAVGAVARFGRR